MSASEVELNAAIRIWATDSTAMGPLAADRDSEARGVVIETEDESTICCGTRSCPLPVSITQEARFIDT